MMASHTSPLLSLLLLLLLPRPSQLYSMHNCSMHLDNLWIVNCDRRELTMLPSDIPRSAQFLSAEANNIRSLRRIDLFGFHQLQTLNLNFNHIVSIESGAFLYSPTLTELSLISNRLTNLTEDMFKGLSSLTHLSLGDNWFQVIPKKMFEPLTNLQELRLFGNNLYSISDLVTSLFYCPHLQVLDLWFNKFTSFKSMDFPFPLNITDLDLTYNPLENFTLHANVLPRLKSLTLSDLQSNIQWDVSNTSFLQNLRSLDLSFENLNIETYKMIFQSVTSIDSLRLSDVQYLLNRGLLDVVCSIPSFQNLDLRSSGLSVLNSSWFIPCSNITDLDLSHNSLLNLPSLHMLKHLSKLDIGSNKLAQVPETIRNMSSLTVLSLSTDNIMLLDCSDFSGLWRLTKLDLSNNHLTELDSCVFHDLRGLQELNIEHNRLNKLDDTFSLALPNLLVLTADDYIGILGGGVFKNMSNLREMTISFLSHSRGVFDGLMNLRYLNYIPVFICIQKSGAVSGTASRGHPLSTPFKDLHSLQTLIIYDFPLFSDIVVSQDFLKGLDNLTTFSSTRLLAQPHPEMFTYTPRLMNLNFTHNNNWNLHEQNLLKPLSELQHLDLTGNSLETLHVLSGNLSKLERLILAKNELKIIDESIFKRLSSLKYLDLSDNPFVCNCSNADFISWVLYNTQVFVADTFQYKCAYPLSQKDQLLLSFDVQSCWESVSFTCFMSSSALVLVTLLSSFIYHFLRWQLVYGYYLFRAFLYDGRKRRQGCAHVYDAFVSYNVHDEEWVYHRLVPELEEQQGWKLCLHHRDFEPGKAIVENITDAIYSSRKTLCVISRRYLQSEWCSREIQMASFRLFDEQKDVLIMLFLEEISSVELSPFYRMRKLVKSRSYLSWTQTRTHRGLFWERVQQALESGNDPTEAHNLLTANV